jgi:hypothetical protein
VAKSRVLVSFVGLATAAVLVGPAPVAQAAPVLDYTPVASWWGTNGRVTDIVVSGDHAYLGGGFDYVGPQTGYGTGVDGTTGVKLPNAPMIDGAVYASVPDGAGGWYVAGAFTTVGGVARKNAARIGADGVLAKWNPKPNGAVYALAVSGGNVVLGGAFSQVGKTPVAASRIGEVDGSGGSAVAAFSAPANGNVRALIADGSSLYVAGEFTTVSGASRSRLARVNATTGAVDGGFTSGTGGTVSALALAGDGSTLYAGGTFTSASGPVSQSRSRLAAWSTSDGSLTSWAPAADGNVEALAADAASGTVYAGGLFGSVNGVVRGRLAGIDSSGFVTSFDPALSGCQTRHTVKDGHSNPVCTPEVSSLTATGGSLYVGGRFGQSGTTTRHDVAAFALADGSLTAWDPVASDRVLTLGVSAGNIFVGGELTSLNGLVRKGVAALSLSTGAGDPTFTADTDDEVLDLQLSPDGSTLFLAGHFSTVNGLIRKHLASVSTSNGAVTGFQANTDNDVLTIAYAGGALYAGGQFIRVNGIDQGHMTKVDPLTGAVNQTFSVTATGRSGPRYGNGMVEAIVASADGSRIFMGGPFTVLNGNSIAMGIVAVDANTGTLLAKFGAVEGCQPRVGPWINRMTLTPDGTRLVGGDICPDRLYVWDAINMTTPQNPTGLIWKSGCNGGMQGILVVNGSIYYGTHGTKGSGTACWASPTNHTNVARSRYAVFDLNTGVLLPDNPQFGSAMGVWSIAATPGGLLVGGDFDWVGSGKTVRQGLAFFPGTV